MYIPKRHFKTWHLNRCLKTSAWNQHVYTVAHNQQKTRLQAISFKSSSTNPWVNTASAVHFLQLTSLKRSYDQHYLKRFGLKPLATDHNLSTRDYIITSQHNKYIQIPYTVLMRWYHAFMNDARECSMKFTIFDPGPINPEPLLIRFWLWCELTIAQIRLIQTFALRS